MFSNHRVDFLERRVSSLETEIRNLRRTLDERTTVYGPPFFIGSPAIAVTDIVNAIADHLGLEIRSREATPAGVELRKIAKK